MRVATAIGVMLLTACGRIGFAPVSDSNSDVMIDAPIDGGGFVGTQRAYVKASNTGMTDNFGYSVAMSSDGETLAVGAPLEDSATTGIDGIQGDDTAQNSGAVYLYRRTNDHWLQEAYIKASTTEMGDELGLHVSLSADGSTLAVSAPLEDSIATGVGGDETDNSSPSSGAVFVFTRTGTTWSQQAYLKASNTDTLDFFGTAIGLSATGDTLAIAANSEDGVAAAAGAVYVFTRAGTVWTQQAYVKASNAGSMDVFGDGLSLSADGDTMVIAASYEDSSATGIDGNQIDESAVDSGAVYVFARVGTTWSQQAYLKASNTDASDRFGDDTAVSTDGNMIVVGAPGEASAATGLGGDQTNNSAIASGAAYVFLRTGTTWSQQAYVKASNTGNDDQFGTSLAVSADGMTFAACGFGEDSAATGTNGNAADDSAVDSGAVYVFSRTATSWTQQAYVKASNTESGDDFGVNIALSGDGTTLAVGAHGEGSSATGVDGDATNNASVNSGAVYLYY